MKLNDSLWPRGGRVIDLIISSPGSREFPVHLIAYRVSDMRSAPNPAGNRPAGGRASGTFGRGRDARRI
jgi:hypothetical protein